MADRSGLVLGARIASGTVAAAVAAVVVAGLALLPLPTAGVEPRTVTIDPAPADQLRVCSGAAVRIGDEVGGSADRAFTIGAASIDGHAENGDLERSRLSSADPAAPGSASPEVLRVPPADGALVAGGQSQDVDAPDFRGLAAAACAEPSGSIWLVGGATTVGRTTLLLLSNPTAVPSRVSLEIFGEDGRVSAPGMSGIDVPADGQRVLSLAGYAPGLESPVVHVTARGGRVVAQLQQSIVRGLDAVGVETIGGGADPGESLVVPGVRILDSVGTSRASALADWQDIGPAIRVAVPGDADARVTVRVVPEGPDAVGTSFELDVTAGGVAELPLDAGEQEGEHEHGLADGLYSVFVDADVPVVAAVRTSTAVDSGVEAAPDEVLTAPESDLTWSVAAPALAGTTLVVVPDGPSPLVSIVNPTAADVDVDVAALAGGAAQLVTIPAGSAVSVPVAPGAYLLSGSDGLSVAVTFAAPGRLASFVVSPPRPVAGPIVVHPD